MRKFLIASTILAMGVTTLASPSLATTKGTEISNITSPTEKKVTTKVLEGTDSNWTKLKVVGIDGKIEYIERKEDFGVTTFKIYNEQYEQTDILTSDKEGNIEVNGEEFQPENITKTSTISLYPSNPTSAGIGTNVVDPGQGSGFYLIETINGSYSSDWNSAATGISLLSALFGTVVGTITTLVNYIIGENINNVWYTKRKYSDKKPYRPTIKIYTTHYANSSRTLYIGTTEHVY